MLSKSQSRRVFSRSLLATAMTLSLVGCAGSLTPGSAQVGTTTEAIYLRSSTNGQVLRLNLPANWESVAYFGGSGDPNLRIRNVKFYFFDQTPMVVARIFKFIPVESGTTLKFTSASLSNVEIRGPGNSIINANGGLRLAACEANDSSPTRATCAHSPAYQSLGLQVLRRGVDGYSVDRNARITPGAEYVVISENEGKLLLAEANENARKAAVREKQEQEERRIRDAEDDRRRAETRRRFRQEIRVGTGTHCGEVIEVRGNNALVVTGSYGSRWFPKDRLHPAGLATCMFYQDGSYAGSDADYK